MRHSKSLTLLFPANLESPQLLNMAAGFSYTQSATHKLYTTIAIFSSLQKLNSRCFFLKKESISDNRTIFLCSTNSTICFSKHQGFPVNLLQNPHPKAW